MGRPYNMNYKTIKNSDYNTDKDRVMMTNITYELRNFANSGMSAMECSAYSDQLTAIADRIDAAHEETLSQAYMDVSDSEWIRLPKDADNVPWKPGDRDEDGNVVTHLMLTSDGWFVTDGEWPYRPKSKRHYHAPTVEDVLCDLLNEYRENECTLEEARLSEYASKLRLAEERENA